MRMIRFIIFILFAAVAYSVNAVDVKSLSSQEIDDQLNELAAKHQHYFLYVSDINNLFGKYDRVESGDFGRSYIWELSGGRVLLVEASSDRASYISVGTLGNDGGTSKMKLIHK